MKKATAPASPVSLGTKRQCPKCAAKFYDFNKEEIVCPKCGVKIDPASLQVPFKVALAESNKKAKAAAKAEEEEASPVGGEAFESVEEISDDDEDVTEDIDVDEDEEDEF